MARPGIDALKKVNVCNCEVLSFHVHIANKYTHVTWLISFIKLNYTVDVSRNLVVLFLNHIQQIHADSSGFSKIQ